MKSIRLTPSFARSTSAIAISACLLMLVVVVLFLTLPFGVHSQTESDETVAGSDPGAPIKTMMARKLLWTTVISAVIFAIALVFYRLGYLNVGRLSELMGFSPLHTRQ